MDEDNFQTKKYGYIQMLVNELVLQDQNLSDSEHLIDCLKLNSFSQVCCSLSAVNFGMSIESKIFEIISVKLVLRILQNDKLRFML